MSQSSQQVFGYLILVRLQFAILSRPDRYCYSIPGVMELARLKITNNGAFLFSTFITVQGGGSLNMSQT